MKNLILLFTLIFQISAHAAVTLGTAASPSFGSGSGNGASVNLDNLESPTAINQHLLPEASGTLNLGSSSAKFGTIWSTGAQLEAYDQSWWGPGFGLVMDQDAHADDTLMVGSKDHATNSTNAATYLYLFTGEKPGASSTGSTGGMYAYTGDNEGSGPTGEFFFSSGEAKGSGKSGNMAFQSGNVSAGSAASGDVYVASGQNTSTGNTGPLTFATGNASGGNSGNMTFTIGTASGTAGVFKFLKSGSAPSVGHVWTASNADGTGYWAAPAGGSAVNSKLILTTPGTTTDGWGTTNLMVRRWTVTTATTADLTYADSATNGMSVTVNTTGLYYMSFGDSYSGGTAFMGITVNASGAELTGTEIYNILMPTRIAYNSSPSGVISHATTLWHLTAGDVVRTQGVGNSDCNGQYCTFFMVRVL